MIHLPFPHPDITDRAWIESYFLKDILPLDPRKLSSRRERTLSDIDAKYAASRHEAELKAKEEAAERLRRDSLPPGLIRQFTEKQGGGMTRFHFY